MLRHFFFLVQLVDYPFQRFGFSGSFQFTRTEICYDHLKTPARIKENDIFVIGFDQSCKLFNEIGKVTLKGFAQLFKLYSFLGPERHFVRNSFLDKVSKQFLTTELHRVEKRVARSLNDVTTM